MWVLGGSGELVNLDRVNRLFTNNLGDCTLIGADFGPGQKPGNLGKYEQEKTAKELIAQIAQAMADERILYIMPDNHYDVVNTKIMDSRVKRRGGS